jgi:mannose/fructose/N-acetylgalactosamine-specific phosphotransferase system component IID
VSDDHPLSEEGLANEERPVSEEGFAGDGRPARQAIRRSDLGRAASRSFQIQALLQPERMQGLGFGFAMVPILRRLYADPAERGAALRRHLAYFATHPVLAGFVLGTAAKLEERRAAGEPIPDAAIDGAKRAMATPLAGLGDPLFWVTLRPLAGLIGVIALLLLPPPETGAPDARVLLCPLFLLLTYNAVALPYRLAGVARGYRDGDRPAALLRSLQLSERNAVLERAGAFAFGAFLVLASSKLGAGGPGSGSAATGGPAWTLLLAPLALGAVVGLVGRRALAGRPVEVALVALLAGCVMAAWV